MAASSEEVLLQSISSDSNISAINNGLGIPPVDKIAADAQRLGEKHEQTMQMKEKDIIHGTTTQLPDPHPHHLTPGTRISSYGQDPVQFNLRMMDTREKVLKTMLLSSYRSTQREIEAEERRQAEIREKELETEERNRMNMRRQLVRGQELDQVQASVVNYDFASLRNAEADHQLTTSMLTLLTSVSTRRNQYASRLKARLES